MSKEFSAFDGNCPEFSLSSLKPKDGFWENLKLPDEGSRLLLGCDLLKPGPCPIAGLDWAYEFWRSS
jgi:hypothetical protein